ncbi:hypothetical protein [Streptomyces sp. NPDC006463]|uniref:hypothetical protein n=1 Tax=Streptomyces sp. NPDC006463 TaxID=3364746 RepID=UPI0036CD70C7
MSVWAATQILDSARCAVIATTKIKQLWTFVAWVQDNFTHRVLLARLLGGVSIGRIRRRADAPKDKRTLIFWIVSDRLSNKEVL